MLLESMARAELLKRLFRSHQDRDDSAFRAAAAELIDDERKKHHQLIAKELRDIMLDSGGTDNSRQRSLVPMDIEKSTPLFSVRHCDRYLSELVLTPDIKKIIERVLDEYKKTEILRANSLAPATKLLFCGPPGCGKTATAQAVATELELPLLYINFDSVVSSFLGETASNIRKIFDFASRGRWVVFFDEFDALARSRDDISEHGEIKRVVNSLLQIIDSYRLDSIIIGATNFEQVLDPAIWRRFDELVSFPMPSGKQLEEAVAKFLHSMSIPHRDIANIAKQLAGRASFSDAEQVCNHIRKACILQGSRKVTAALLVDAVEHFEYRKSVLNGALASGSHPIVTQPPLRKRK
jgi:SpoVK/Ycf46/Vps4 family AAA+-type ATPase